MWSVISQSHYSSFLCKYAKLIPYNKSIVLYQNPKNQTIILPRLFHTNYPFQHLKCITNKDFHAKQLSNSYKKVRFNLSLRPSQRRDRRLRRHRRSRWAFLQSADPQRRLPAARHQFPGPEFHDVVTGKDRQNFPGGV